MERERERAREMEKERKRVGERERKTERERERGACESMGGPRDEEVGRGRGENVSWGFLFPLRGLPYIRCWGFVLPKTFWYYGAQLSGHHCFDRVVKQDSLRSLAAFGRGSPDC